MSKSQLYDMLTQIKEIDQKDPDKARNLLLEKPALALALFQAEIFLGCIPQSLPQYLTTDSTYFSDINKYSSTHELNAFSSIPDHSISHLGETVLLSAGSAETHNMLPK